MQAIIFDMDGVLVDSEPLDREAWAEVLGRYGVRVSEHELISLIGKPAEAVLEHYRHKTGLELHDRILLEKHSVFYELARDHLSPMPGVKEFIEHLRDRKILLAVASSSSQKRIHFTLSHTGLYTYFQALCSGEEVVNSKPAPDVFLLAASKLKIDPNSCAVIEDSIHGITAARRAGMDVYGFTSSFPADVLKTAGATSIFDNYRSLKEILRINYGD